MKSLYITFFIGVLLIYLIRCQEEENPQPETQDEQKEDQNEEEQKIEFTSKNIISLTESAFNEMKENNETFFLLLYANWCNFCKEFSPIYSQLADVAIERSLPFKITILDGEVYPDFNFKYNISGYPMLFFFFNGKNSTYEYTREYEKIIQYADKKMHGPVIKLNSVTEVKSYCENRTIVLLSTMDPSSHQFETSEFAKASEKNDYIDFISCYTAECVKEYHNFPILLFRSFDEPIIPWPMSDIIACINIEILIDIYKFPLAGTFDEFSSDAILEHNNTALLYFRDSSNKTQTDKDIIFANVHKDFRDVLLVFTLDVKGDRLFELASPYFNVFQKDLPKVLLLLTEEDGAKRTVFECNLTIDEYSIENFRKWMYAYYEGKVNRLPLSEPVPKMHMPNVRKIVGYTWEEEVIKSNKSVVVLFVGEGCDDDCRYAATFWHFMGEKYEDSEEVMFGIIDMTLNEVFGLDLKRFPVVMMYVKGKKDKPGRYTDRLREVNFEHWIAWQMGWASEDILIKEEREKEKVEEDKKEDL